MQPILPGITSGSALTLTSTVPALRSWQVGQILQAVAITDSVDNQVSLRIGATRIEAQTQTPITAGQTLQLQVVRLGEQPILKVLPAAAAPAEPVAVALRTALPKQTGMAPLLANLNLLGQSGAVNSTPAPLPAPVLQLAARIYHTLVDSSQASTARGLQQALHDTGVFLEAKLAQLAHGAPAELGTDLKRALLQLQQLLRDTPRSPATPTASPARAPSPAAALPETALPDAAPTAPNATAATGRANPPLPPAPPVRGGAVQAQAPVAPSLARLELAGAALDALQQQTEGALARLQLHQLASLPNASAPQPTWLLELPIRHQEQVDLFHLRIESEAGNGGAGTSQQRPWVVTLAFDLAGLGPVHARVTVLGEQASTAFWTERASTAQAFQAHLDTLREQLQQSGLAVGTLACHCGPPPFAPPAPHTPVMDTRA